ncbi:hypothetical protein CSUB01_08546 [Colletotrichum sublineola]|uniref:Uncharacterized protein n=1 Tax=Colletotrichum sublineola TaxID=1173701 RepID=A0A066XGA4_COLSU|nr:hypothetical protein CSUB01_08546 [Colletotrichum sublineola]
MNGKYQFLSSADPELSNSHTSSDDDNLHSIPSTEQRWKRFGRRFGISFALFVSLLATFAIGRHVGYEDASANYQRLQTQSSSSLPSDWKSESSGSSQQHRCQDPYFRKEWRSLSKKEKQDYLEAAKCLAHTPSILTGNGTIHDDFAYVHMRHAHSGKPRFASSREFRVDMKCIYERSARTLEHCQSPVFSNVTGFGGNGNSSAPLGVGEGHCVTDGPFADLRPLYYESQTQPHCLSRGFTDFPGKNVNPEAVEKCLGQKNYDAFFLAVEKGPHDMAPDGIRGEFYSFAAPSGKQAFT